jgi:hypothetical protein
MRGVSAELAGGPRIHRTDPGKLLEVREAFRQLTTGYDADVRGLPGRANGPCKKENPS